MLRYSEMTETPFSTKTVYRISTETLFLPAIFYKRAIGSTDRFIVAIPPKMYGKRSSDYYWFRSVDAAANHVFGIPKKYADKIVPADEANSATDDTT